MAGLIAGDGTRPWAQPPAQPGDLERDVLAAMTAVLEQPYEPDPCQLGRHLLNPRAWREAGWYVCASCAMPVEVKRALGER